MPRDKRIYLTGFSLGGRGAWWTAQDYPEFFAALAPVCGGKNRSARAWDTVAKKTIHPGVEQNAWTNAYRK